MRYYLDGFSFYKRHFVSILVLGLTISLPLLLLSEFISYFILGYNIALGTPFLSTVPQFIVSLTFLFVIQLPFIYLTSKSVDQDRPSYSEIYDAFFKNVFPVYVIGALVSLLISLGSILFIIPGVILLVLFMTFPFVAVLEEKRWFKGLKRAVSIGMENFFSVLGVAILLSVISLVVNWIFQFVAVMLTGSFLIYSFAQIIFDILFIPYLAAVTTYYFHDWTGISFDWD